MDAFNRGEISDYEMDCLTPKETTVGRLKGLAKDHKEFERIPDFRPICSINGCMIEALSRFVDYHSRELIDTIKSHLDHTPHFFRKIETFKNSMPYIPDDVVPVTIDVIGLYPNIPTDDPRINNRLIATPPPSQTSQRIIQESTTDSLPSHLLSKHPNG